MDRTTKIIIFLVYPLITVAALMYELRSGTEVTDIGSGVFYVVRTYLALIFLPLVLVLVAFYLVADNIFYSYAILVCASFLLVAYFQIAENKSIIGFFKDIKNTIIGSLLFPLPVVVLIYIVYLFFRGW